MVEFNPAAPLAVLILAHNEAGVIAQTVSSVVRSLAPEETIFVVADNCTDETASVAAKAGARVYPRTTGIPDGKAKALAWFMQEHLDQLHDFGVLVILDADSKVGEQFSQSIRVNLKKTSTAYQCFVHPLHAESPIGKLAALSELLDQTISDRIRTTFGWPVRLRGTGMVITPDVLSRVSDRLRTDVEDIALTLLLVSEGVRIARIDKALVLDQKPISTAMATQQRARWYRGQWLAAWSYRKEILRVLLQGPGGWSVLSSLFLRPKWLITTIILITALLLNRWPWIALPFWLFLLGNLFFLVIGLIRIPDRRIYLRALLYSPAFIWMWLHSILLALQPSSWRKAR